MFQLLLAVFIGGGTGSVARWLLSMRFNPLHQIIPLGTLAANLIGAFIIGMACLYVNIPFGVLTLCMACIVGATRVLCGLHFIRDVLIGAGISVVLGIIGFYVFPLFVTIPAF